MPIGSTNVYNSGDLILSTVSGSGTSFIETKIVASTSSLIYFDSNARITSASLNSVTVGTASYVNALTQSVLLKGSVKFDPSLDPNPSGNYVSSSYLFVSSSNTQLGYDLYVRQNGNLTKWKWIEGQINTGLLYGGALSNSGSTIYVSKGAGIVVSQNAVTSSEVGPILSYVTWNDYTSSIASRVTSSQATYVYVGSDGSINLQDDVFFTTSQYATNIPLGMFNHTGRNSITSVANNVYTTYNTTNQSFDFIQAFGPLKINGLTLTGQSGTLRINIGAGTSFILGGFYQQDPNNISHKDTNAYNTASIARVYRSGSGTFNTDNNGGAFYTVIDPTKYDNGTGTLATVGNNWTIQRVFFNPFTGRTHVYYGQEVYDKLATAVANLAADSFTEAIYTSHQYVLVAYLIVYGATTDLTNTTENSIVQAGLFRSTVGSSGGTTFTTNLTDLADVAITSPSAYDLFVYNGSKWANTKTLLGGITSSVFGTSSWASNALTASSISSTGNAFIQGGNSFGTTATLGTNDATSLAFETSGSERIRILTNGHVGIGTSSPTSRLEVLAPSVALASQPSIIGNFKGDTDGRSLIRVENVNSNTGANAAQAGISFILYSTSSNQPSANKHEAQIILASTNASTVGQAGTLQIIAPLDIAFNVSSSNTIMTGSSYGVYGSNAMYISRTGNVGIGTTNPAARLSISGSGNGSGLIGDAGFGVAGNYTAISLNGTLSTTSYNILSSPTDPNLYINRPTGTDIRFREVNNDQMVLSTGGNLGIGTSSPAYKLDVSGSTRFGFTSTNTHQFTGSVNVNGSLFTNANITASNISASGTGSFGIVGIGTSSPSQRLSVVSGSALLASTALAGELYFGNDGTNIYLKRDNSYDLSLVQNGDSNSGLYLAGAGNVYVNIDSNNNDTDKAFIVQNNALKAGTELFRVQENGNVGIGTSITSEILDVYRVAGYSNWSPRIVARDGTNAAFIGCYNSQPGVYAHNNALNAWATLYINTTAPTSGSAASGNVLIGGSVGIGTNSPSTKLHVSGSTTAAYFEGYVRVGVTQNNTIGTSGDPSSLQVQNINIHPNSTTETMYIRRIGSGQYQLQTILASANSGEIHLQPYGGNVGIGTTNPSFLLDVSGSSRHGWSTSNTHQFTGSVNVNGSIFTNASITASNISASNITGSLFGTSSWSSNSLTASYLVPTNSYQITNLTASNISASGTVRALSLVETSTVEAKYNIIPLGSQLDKVLQLNPVSFTYKLTNQSSIGLIAEEVGEIYPEFTSPDKDAVAYSKIVSVLIQSVKELKSIVDDQQKQINKLLNK